MCNYVLRSSLICHTYLLPVTADKMENQPSVISIFSGFDIGSRSRIVFPDFQSASLKLTPIYQRFFFMWPL